MYEIIFVRSARRELESLPRTVAERILTRIAKLADTTRPRGCCKLQGGEGLWRIRVGDYRIVYSVDVDLQAVDIAVVRHRSDAYT